MEGQVDNVLEMSRTISFSSPAPDVFFSDSKTAHPLGSLSHQRPLLSTKSSQYIDITILFTSFHFLTPSLAFIRSIHIRLSWPCYSSQEGSWEWMEDITSCRLMECSTEFLSVWLVFPPRRPTTRPSRIDHHTHVGCKIEHVAPKIGSNNKVQTDAALPHQIVLNPLCSYDRNMPCVADMCRCWMWSQCELQNYWTWLETGQRASTATNG